MRDLAYRLRIVLAKMKVTIGLFAFLLFLVIPGCDLTGPAGEEPGDGEESPAYSWYKGNLHTHSYWSNGNDYPEMVAQWYKEREYNFLALSEHNTLSESTRWMDVRKETDRDQIFQEYLTEFGEDWVEFVDRDSLYNVKLKTYDKYRSRTEEEGSFLLLESEEIHDNYRGLPVHVNATNIRQEIEPRSGNSVLEVLQNNIDAVLEQQKEDLPVIAHICHPNIDWAVTAEDMKQLNGLRFFELYSGHPNANNSGDDTHSSVEEKWDEVNTFNVQNGKPLLYGLAVDDAQNYHNFSSAVPNPGRGWIQVRSSELSRDSLIAAMKRGDFYASTGVRLETVNYDGAELSLEIDGEAGVSYTTVFIGTLDSDSENPGVVLAEKEGTRPAYTLTGDELYIRAKVISDKPKENATEADEFEAAWVQPHKVDKD